MRKTFRKGMSILLALVMILSLLPVYAFGATSEDQVMSGYYVVSNDGSYVKDTTGATFVTQDGYTLTKEIDWTNEVNKFNITLTVETAKTVVTNDAAIAIVIDNSSSMDECSEGNSCDGEAADPNRCYDADHKGTDKRGRCSVCGKHKGDPEDVCTHMNRLEAIQNILTKDGGFLDSLKQGDSGKIYVSVICFDEDANKVTEWLDINEGNNLQTVKNAINGIKLGSGTNIHGGLMLGRNRLGMSTLDSVASKHLVLLSDGAPYRISNESASLETIEGFTTWDGDYSTAAKNVAAQIRNAGTTVYSVGYGTDGDVNDLLTNIAGSEARAFAGNDLAGINAAFANIAASAVSGMNGAGTYVTDPMGQYINFAGFLGEAASGASVANNGTITWALDPAEAETRTEGDTTYYTYTLKYTITLDTAAEGFKEFEEDGTTPKYYPANGYTYLTTPDGEIPFLVPGVKGEIPEYEWAVEYYLEDESSINKESEDKTYTLDKTDNMKAVDLWTIVDAPEGYENEYNGKGYHFANGEPLQLTISADSSKNVIRLYYNLDVAQVTVKHFYKTTTITPAGETVVGEYIEDADKTSTVFAILGSRFEATEQPVFGGINYTFDKAEPSNKSVTVSADEENNLIQLYYSREDDQRIETTAQVDHVYETYTYKTNDEGKYEEVVLSVKEEKAQYSENLRATTVYDVSAEPKAGYEDFELDSEKGDYSALVMEGGKLGFVLQDKAEDNIRTLYFKKIVDNREKIQVTVNHYYTKNITTIDEDGKVQNTKNPDNVLGSTETYDVYKGDSLTIEEVKLYNNEFYTPVEGNADKLEIDQVTGSMNIDLYYELSEVPEVASAFASHYWRTFTDVTVEVIETVTVEVVDEETGEVSVETNEVVTGTRVETRESIDHKIEGIEYEGLFEGQKHIEMPKNWGEGYVLNIEASDDVAIAGSDDHATLYYDKSAEADARRDANVTVIHNYFTNLETIVGGEIVTVRQNDGSVKEDTVEGKAGDKFEAVPETTYNENDYTRLTDDKELTIVLQPGTNVIVINYERNDSALVDTDYNVNYEYRTYTMTINEAGLAGYWDEPAVETDEVSGDGYVGQKITLDPKAKEGFELVSGANTVQYLEADGNTWAFIYEKYIPLENGSVTVNHHYKTITVAVNGTTSESTQDVLGTPDLERHIGEEYTAQAVLNGYTLTGVEIDSEAAEMAEEVEVIVGKNTVIDFYYEKTDDFSVPVTYSIAHEYYTYDWDGTPIGESKPDPVTGTGFATNPLVAAPEYNDYTLTSVTYNGTALDKSLPSHTVILQEGENKIVFVYEKTLVRDYVDVTVIHNYYKDEAALAEGLTESKSLETFEKQAEGSVFTAEMKEINGYSFHSADPAEMSITVSDAGENVIVINYIRDEAAYEVIHVYQRNGSEEGRTTEQLSGLHGEVIDSDSITRVETYNGNTYAFVSATADITLDSEAETLPVIVLTYNRTVSNPPYNPPYNPPVNPPVDPPADPPEIEIPDEDVPLDDVPEDIELPEEIEIPDEEVPLSGVPVTGDTSFIWMAISAASGAGLLQLFRKRKDEE